MPKRLQHYIPGGELTYTDIIRYDPKLLEQPPFKLIVHSIPPIFKNKVHLDQPALASFHMCWERQDHQTPGGNADRRRPNGNALYLLSCVRCDQC